MAVTLRTRVKEEPYTSRKPTSHVNRRRRRRRSSTASVSASEEDDNESHNNDHSSRNTGRPFDIVGDLPCTIEPPEYNSTLSYPLSVKDSGVLYTSLLNSRKSWIKGEMFELYWSKPIRTPIAPVTPMTIVGRKRKSASVENEGDENGITSLIKDKMQKMSDCNMLAGPHTFPIRLFILKDEEIEKKWQLEQDAKKQEKEEKKKVELELKTQRMEERKRKQLQRKKEKELQKEMKAKAKLPYELEKQKRKEEFKKLKEQGKLVKKQPRSNSSTSLMSFNSSSDLNKKGLGPTSGTSLSPNSEMSPPMNDPKMIANLNRMAKKDPKLNNLMSVVAAGGASLEEIEKFRAFIGIARRMPPPPGWVSPIGPTEKTKQAIIKEKEQKQQEEKEEQGPQLKVSMDKTNSADNSGSTNKNEHPKTSEVGTLGDKKEKPISNMEKTKTVSQDHGQSIDSKADNTKDIPKDEPVNSVDSVKKEILDENGNVLKPAKRKYKRRSTSDVNHDKSNQLTGFQQKYVNGAKLIIEYLEYTHARYILPHDAIIEFVKDSEEYIISWIVIHNKKDMEKHLKRHKMTMNEYLAMADPPVLPLFSTMTIKFSGIENKFKSILLNSVNKVEEVQKQMDRIIEIGTRLTGYNLWFQLDGYDDNEMAENLRFELNQYEHSIKGKRQRRK